MHLIFYVKTKEKSLLPPGTSEIFTVTEKKILYNTSVKNKIWSNIPQLLNKLGCINYKQNDWRLFIDTSKRSHKGVHLHNGNELSSVPVGHSNIYHLIWNLHYTSSFLIHLNFLKSRDSAWGAGLEIPQRYSRNGTQIPREME